VPAPPRSTGASAATRQPDVAPEFERLLLLAIAHVGGEAYDLPSAEEIEGRTGGVSSAPAR
jgi:hypothetical protein